MYTGTIWSNPLYTSRETEAQGKESASQTSQINSGRDRLKKRSRDTKASLSKHLDAVSSPLPLTSIPSSLRSPGEITQEENQT